MKKLSIAPRVVLKESVKNLFILKKQWDKTMFTLQKTCKNPDNNWYNLECIIYPSTSPGTTQYDSLIIWWPTSTG